MKAVVGPGVWKVDVSETSELDLTRGVWERYEHPEKGDTLTLFADNGKAVLSLHNTAVAESSGAEIHRMMALLGSPEWGITVMARVAILEHELQIAVKRIAELEASA